MSVEDIRTNDECLNLLLHFRNFAQELPGGAGSTSGIFQINNFRGVCIKEFQADSFFLCEKFLGTWIFTSFYGK